MPKAWCSLKYPYRDFSEGIAQPMEAAIRRRGSLEAAAGQHAERDAPAGEFLLALAYGK